MAADDRAIVVGLSAYPGLGNLDGPENDAKAFHAWLTSPTGGDVAQAKLILSSDFPPFTSATLAEPQMGAIYREFDLLEDVAEANKKQGMGLRVGRRLYLYLAGHGFGPDLEEAALLMANATPTRTSYHVPGKLNANRFLRQQFFDEVVLLMDCCREKYPSAPLFLPNNLNRSVTDVDNTKRFYGYSCKWGKLSRERIIDGETHGVFTATVLAGLKGAAALNGQITAASLGGYLYENMKKMLHPADLENPDVAKEPDLQYDPNEGKNFVIATMPDPVFPVNITFSSATVGRPVRLFDGQFTLLSQTVANGGSWQLSLRRGLYLAVADGGAQTSIDVSGSGGVDAAL
jgi:hypothetical protein